jgi:hypothetical protein|tara:strand:- start:502 stop:792 length:291 start_codon:yes stop_codon:yes gene_type:complete
LKSFGVDPVFRKTSTVSDSTIARSPRLFESYYNQSNTNIDIISYSGLPYGYHPNINGTVAVWFDVAMSAKRAQEVSCHTFTMNTTVSMMINNFYFT